MRHRVGFGAEAGNALPALADILEESDDDEVRVAAIRAMKTIGDIDPVVVPALIKAKQSPNKKIAKEAKKALKKLK